MRHEGRTQEGVSGGGKRHGQPLEGKENTAHGVGSGRFPAPELRRGERDGSEQVSLNAGCQCVRQPGSPWGLLGRPGRREQIERLIKMDTEHLEKKCGFIKKS